MPSSSEVEALLASRYARSLAGHLERADLRTHHGRHRALVRIEAKNPDGRSARAAKTPELQWAGILEGNALLGAAAHQLAVKVLRPMGEGVFVAELLDSEDQIQLAFSGHLERAVPTNTPVFRMIAV